MAVAVVAGVRYVCVCDGKKEAGVCGDGRRHRRIDPKHRQHTRIQPKRIHIYNKLHTYATMHTTHS